MNFPFWSTLAILNQLFSATPNTNKLELSLTDVCILLFPLQVLKYPRTTSVSFGGLIEI
jgi:hypothetical protein